MSRGWVGIVSPAAARVSELIGKALLADGTSSDVWIRRHAQSPRYALLRPKRQIVLTISALHQHFNPAYYYETCC